MISSEPSGAVSAVIPTYGRRSLLPTIIAPLLDDPATREVIVVVDGSSDGSLELLHSFAQRDPRVVPIAIPNSGTHEARSIGIERASGDIVLLLDDDVVAAPGLVTGHARHHAAQSRTVAVGYMPVVLPPRSDPRLGPSYVYAHSYEGACDAYEQNPSLLLRYLWGGNVSFRRAGWTHIIDRAWSARGYHADQELGLRLLEAGMVGVFDRSLRASHLYRRSFSAFLQDARRSGSDLARIRKRYADLLGNGATAPQRRWRHEFLSLVAERHRLRSLVVTGLGCLAAVAARLGFYSAARRALGRVWMVEAEAAMSKADGVSTDAAV